MGKTPTAREAISLLELAQLLRGSAAATSDANYVELFLSAAAALEARAETAPVHFIDRTWQAARL